MNSLGKDSLLTLWAIPKKEEIPLFLSAKQTIDNKLEGPPFPIHMTLASQFELNLSKVKDLESTVNFIKRYTKIPVCFDTEGAQIRTTNVRKKIF